MNRYLQNESRFFVGRFFFTGDTASGWHCHDFAELFWVRSGRIRHTTETGEEILESGDLRFMRPEQAHALARVGSAIPQLTNIALPADILEIWPETYPVLKGRFFWADPSEKRTISDKQTFELERRVNELAAFSGDLFFVHRFLLDLFFESLPPAPSVANVPHWLQEGLAALGRRDVFCAGPSAFAGICGRSLEHVSRETRKHLNKSPTELINEIRMNDAASQLRMTDKDILTIMMDCGLSNPSHFYKLFRSSYGETPRQYRLTHSELVGHSVSKSIQNRKGA